MADRLSEIKAKIAKDFENETSPISLTFEDVTWLIEKVIVSEMEEVN